MKRILFYYFNLEHNEKYARGILQTRMPLEVIHSLMLEGKSLEDILEIINEKEDDAVYVKLSGYPLERAEAEIPHDTLYSLSNNKYITRSA